MKNDMPEEILIYMGAASGHPQILREEQNTVNAVKYIRADLTEPVKCNCTHWTPEHVKHVEAEAKPLIDSLCDSEPVIDDGLLAEAADTLQQAYSRFYDDDPFYEQKVKKATELLIAQRPQRRGKMTEAEIAFERIIKAVTLSTGGTFHDPEDAEIVRTALKTREEPVEVTGEKMAASIYQCIEKAMQDKDFQFTKASQAILELLKLFKNGIKIINPPNNRDEEKI